MPICKVCNKSNYANDIFCTSCGVQRGLNFRLSQPLESKLFALKFPEELKFPEPPFYITPDICEYVIARDILWKYLHQVSLWRMLVLTFLSDLPELEKVNYSNYPYIKLSDRTHDEFISQLQTSKQARNIDRDRTIKWEYREYHGCNVWVYRGPGFPQIIFEAGNTSLIETVMDIFSWRNSIICWILDGRYSAGCDLNDRDWYYIGQFMNYTDAGHICELCFTNHIDNSPCMFGGYLIT